jgi:hypothetical protein
MPADQQKSVVKGEGYSEPGTIDSLHKCPRKEMYGNKHNICMLWPP